MVNNLKLKHLKKTQTKDAIISYLSSDLFKGIGKRHTQNIVNTLGENAINDILTDPSVLENVPSLAKSNKNRLQNKLVQIKSQKNNDSLT